MDWEQANGLIEILIRSVPLVGTVLVVALVWIVIALMLIARKLEKIFSALRLMK